MRFSSAYNIFRQILDAIFPPQERVAASRSLSVDDLKALGPTRQPEKPFISAVCDYREPTVRQVVKAAKYDGGQAAIALMSDILREELLALCEEERIFADKIVITPVPISNHRRKEYGFNHSWRIAKEIEKKDKSDIFQAQNLLKKTRETPAQTNLSKKERLENLVGSYAAKETDEELIIVIDDVTTTGATFSESARALKAAGCQKVLALAFAH